MNRSIAAAVLLLAGTATASAQSGGRAFPASGFDSVDLTGADDVRIVTGPTTSVVATGDPRAVAALAIAVRGTTLTIARRAGNWRDHGALVTVTLPALRAARITGSGSIAAAGISGPAVSASVTGSGTLRLPGLRIGAARFQLSGSGDIVADGDARSVAIELGGSGDVDTRRLSTPDLVVNLGGSGDVRAAASRTARITAGGSGDVSVIGGARCSVTKGGTADVSCG